MKYRVGFEPAIDRLVDVTIHSLDLLPCDIMLLNSGAARTSLRWTPRLGEKFQNAILLKILQIPSKRSLI